MAVIQKTAEIVGLLNLQSAQTPKSGNANLEFQKVMETTGTTDKTDDKQQTNDKDVDINKTSSANEVMKDKLAKANKKSNITDENAVPEEAAMEAIQTLLQNIKNLIQDVFQISPEELSNVMETMGITDMDLLNPQVISDLAVQLSGTENPLELLFQPEFTENLKVLQENISAAKEEVFSKLHMTEKEVVRLVEEQIQPEEILPEKELTDTKKADTLDLKAGTEPETASETAEPKAELKTENTGTKEQEMSFGTKEDKNSNQTQNTFANNLITNLEEAITQAAPEVDAAKVVKQVITQLQVAVKADITSFEMQLNPEHLGRINLQIASKNGIVTAQISTETAMAKEVLESQLITLKEALDQQGVKVEAVEVTIASHEFERNLDSQADTKQENPQNETRQHRKLGFDILQAAEEELSPAEAIMREMMLANGSQINYMA